jgi:hypothetical protein
VDKEAGECDAVAGGLLLSGQVNHRNRMVNSSSKNKKDPWCPGVCRGLQPASTSVRFDGMRPPPPDEKERKRERERERERESERRERERRDRGGERERGTRGRETENKKERESARARERELSIALFSTN